MSNYKPRRQSKRYLDGDCPDGVLAIYDHPKCNDRYTVFYTKIVEFNGNSYIGYREMDENPYHPQGIGMYGEMNIYDFSDFRFRSKKFAAKWSSLPENVKKLVKRDLRT